MATEEIEISELEFTEELAPDNVFPIEGTTDTKATSLLVFARWLQNYLVGKTGNEDISGIKNFINSPTVPTAESSSNDKTVANTAFVTSKTGLVLPVGTIIPFGGSTAPSGFLLCNGATISRTTYASLFAKIGTTYGAGDGSTTFALPNLVNVRMLKGSEIPVVGNGKAIGLTHDNNSTIRSMSWGGLTDTTNGSAALTLSNQNTGNLPQSGNLRGNQSNVNLIGMTKTASLSGVVAQISSGVVVRFIIKY